MALLQDLIKKIDDPALRDRILQETNKLMKRKKFGLVFEEHLPECTPMYDVPVKVGAKVALKTGYVSDIYTVLKIDDTGVLCDRRENHEQKVFSPDDLVVVAEFGEPIYPTLQMLDSVENAPDSDLWHMLIEADNYHALQLLEYLYAEKVDCIYIDPPYNTGAKDWKYNNDYVDSNDQYRHSKWLSMMEKRLKLAKKLLNPKDSVLIVTIDEKEYLHLGCLLEEMFLNAKMQMISSVINVKGVARDNEFARVNEYLYILQFGDSKVEALSLNQEWLGNIKSTGKNKVRLAGLMRTGTGSSRRDSPGCFYPIVFSKDGKFKKVGETIPIGVNRTEVIQHNDEVYIWPIHKDGSEGRWMYRPEGLNKLIKDGFVYFGKLKGDKIGISYAPRGVQRKIKEGQLKIIGYDEDGSAIIDDSAYRGGYVPGNQWAITLHNATEYGTKILQSILRNNSFTFPKSLYAVHDAIRFFVANKPDALILDFFAGSGTTLHAVNLLNAEDGGQRRCIMVTNNEVSADEAKRLAKEGHKPGDEEWDKLGIARYVTWPRTCCSILGIDSNGNPLNGMYGAEEEIYVPDEEATLVSKGTGKPLKKKVYIKKKVPVYSTLSQMKMADGFKANAAFFKLSFLDKNAIALGRQFKELLPVLWMKGGAIGRCPSLSGDKLPGMLILPENKMAVLLDEIYYAEFVEEMAKHADIQTVFIVTDSEAAYKDIIRDYADKDCYQLYRDYLDNFRINTGR